MNQKDITRLIVAVIIIMYLKTFSTVDRVDLDRVTKSPIQVLRRQDTEKAKAYVEHLLMRNEGAGLGRPEANAYPLPDGTESLTCTQEQCHVNGPADGVALERIKYFQKVAMSLTPTPDKVTDANATHGHTYQTMYGFLIAHMQHARGKPKLFEIGLGCYNYNGYDHFPSVALWKKLFPNIDLWVADDNGACVEGGRERGLLQNTNALIGDQSDAKTLQDWLLTSGGEFDVVIDDGLHANTHIRISFEALWPHVKPGGLYFLEDLQVGRVWPYNKDYREPVIAERIEAWVEQLLTKKRRSYLPLPKEVETIFCQAEACMIKKASHLAWERWLITPW